MSWLTSHEYTASTLCSLSIAALSYVLKRKRGLGWRHRLGTLLSAGALLEWERIEHERTKSALTRCRELCPELSVSASVSGAMTPTRSLRSLVSVHEDYEGGDDV